jgi:hypothetical protein
MKEIVLRLVWGATIVACVFFMTQCEMSTQKVKVNCEVAE